MDENVESRQIPVDVLTGPLKSQEDAVSIYYNRTFGV